MTDDDPVDGGSGDGGPADGGTPVGETDAAPRAEHRWPMAVATLTAGGLHQFLPPSFLVSPRWVFPAFLLVFLGVLIAGDPGLIDRQRPWLKVTTGLMIATIALVNAVTAIRLVKSILQSGSFNTATAFSPTDVSALKGSAKLMMIAEAIISLALATLVVARAVNIM